MAAVAGFVFDSREQSPEFEVLGKTADNFDSDFWAPPELIRLKEVENEVKALRGAIASPSPDLEMQVLEKRVGGLERELEKLEAIIVKDPAEVLSVIDLRRDLRSQEKETDVQISTIQSSVDRAYELNKWIIGAFAFSLISMAAVQLWSKRPDDNKSSGNSD